MHRIVYVLAAGGMILAGTLTAFIVQRVLQEPPPTPRATVTIPEGSTVSDINEILKREGVLIDAALPEELEGYLFPDTYEFFIPSGPGVVEEKFQENFTKRLASLSAGALSDEELARVITVASLIEKEVVEPDEQRIVAGIIEKRLDAEIPLQMDASICYIKGHPCLPITEEDKQTDSPYNTYQYRGLPPGPISNPGASAISASLNPGESPYWYYLSDPETGETIFAKTLDEHNRNVVKYLGN